MRAMSKRVEAAKLKANGGENKFKLHTKERDKVKETKSHPATLM